MEWGKADEKHPHDHEHLCFGSSTCSLVSALGGFVGLVDLLADQRVANEHQGKRAPKYNLQVNRNSHEAKQKTAANFDDKSEWKDYNGINKSCSQNNNLKETKYFELYCRI